MDFRYQLENAFNPLYLRERMMSNFAERIELFAYCSISFFAPFVLSHPQFLVGTVVNAMLVLAALNIRGRKLLPFAIIPSLGLIASGLVFGSFTYYLIYMAPFIWLGNLILIYGIKELSLSRKMNRWGALMASSSAKAAFLFISAFLLVQMNIVPALFMTSMGLFQLYTALLGGASGFALQEAKNRLFPYEHTAR